MIEILPADPNDLKEILALQYLAYMSEALLLDNLSIPPLKQTLEEVNQEFAAGWFLKAVDAQGAVSGVTPGPIVGSVRASIVSDTLRIGKLIVHPDWQGRGIGTQLLLEIERTHPCHRYELFTSARSARNLRLYEHLGYVRFREEELSAGLTLVYLEKLARINP